MSSNSPVTSNSKVKTGGDGQLVISHSTVTWRLATGNLIVLSSNSTVKNWPVSI